VRPWLLGLVLLVGVAILSACSSAEKAVTPAPTAGARAPWEEEWQRVLAAAKQEGKVAVVGPAGAEARKALSEPFEKKYGISVEFIGGSGSEMGARLKTERSAGQYLWDIFVGGTTTQIETLKKSGGLDPVTSALILPDVTEPKNWRGGKVEFADKDGKYVLVFTTLAKAPIFVNSKLADPKELKSYKDLLNPKWQGKILVHDPRVSGPGQASFTFFYQNKELGPDFIRSLAAQKPDLQRDSRQELDWLAQGKYAILVAGSDFTAATLKKEGVPIEVVDHRQLKEKSYLTSGNGSVSLLNKAPHPNAAKVFINWLLTKEGQTEFARAQGYASRRVDVPTDHLESWMLPEEGLWVSYDEDAVELKDKVGTLLKEVFGD